MALACSVAYNMARLLHGCRLHCSSEKWSEVGNTTHPNPLCRVLQHVNYVRVGSEQAPRCVCQRLTHVWPSVHGA